jgi:hypothetical protein
METWHDVLLYIDNAVLIMKPSNIRRLFQNLERQKSAVIVSDGKTSPPQLRIEACYITVPCRIQNATPAS